MQSQEQPVEILNRDPEEIYTIIRKIGEGGSGSIYAVQKKITRENFALKRIPVKNEKHSLAILNEIRITQVSHNENVVNYFESYSFNDYLWIIVELMRGSLTELVTERAGDIPEELISYICREILKGIDCLHSSMRLHRDIKSDNILLGAEGQIKLGDFGYAAQLTSEQDHQEHYGGHT